eukprot:6155866-Pyramimonas_sp.AAC.1
MFPLVRGPPMCGRWPVGRCCEAGGHLSRCAGPPHRDAGGVGAASRGPSARAAARAVGSPLRGGAPRGPWRARCPREAACRALSKQPN